MKTTAAILWEINTPWSVEEVELDDPQPGEVRVKLASSGLCHSDDHAVKNDIPTGLPIIGGHEGAGVVEEVGPGVTRLKPGDHVVMAFSPYAVVHQDSCVKIDPDIPLELASLVGCGVATGFGAAVNRAQVGPGDTVVVVGTGGVGSSAVQGARVAGAENIIAVDPIPFRREQAEVLGATHSVASMEEAMPLVTDLTRGVMADRTIMTASLMTADMLKPLMLLTRKGGRACLTSTANPTIDKVDVVLIDVIFGQKEIVGNVFGGYNPHADLPRLLSLYQKGQLKLAELVTKTYSLEQINEGYDDLLAGRIMRGMIMY
jgi:Zn-dependent alcohol dehydrogenase